MSDHPHAVFVWHVVAPGYITVALMGFLIDAVEVGSRYERKDQRMGQGVCTVLVQLQSVLHYCIDYHGFTPFVAGGAVDYALAYFAYRRSVEVKSNGRFSVCQIAGFL